MNRPGVRPTVRPLLVLVPAVLAGVLAVHAGWFGGTGDAPATTSGAAPPATAGSPPPEVIDEAVGALLAAMGGDGDGLFSGATDELPAAVEELLRATGVDLLLGVAVTDDGGSVAVAAVFPGSPAERAGIIAGDVITGLGDRTLASGAELRAAVEAVAPGSAYQLTLRRAGALGQVEIPREAPPDGDAWRSGLLRTLALGLMLADRPGGPDLPPSLLGELVEETPDGLRVVAVIPRSPAEEAGVRRGDLLVAVGGHQLSTLADVRSATRLLSPTAAGIEVTLERDGERMTLLVPLTIGGTFGRPSES